MITAILLLTVTLSFPQISAAETFTGEEFLKWPRESQRGYFQASIGMAGFIAAKNDKQQADCMESWYLRNREEAEAVILDAMRRNKKYHPRAVLVAILQKKCGSFDYPRR